MRYSTVMQASAQDQRRRTRGVIARYREHLPVNDKTPVISLGEGNTPLIPCPRLSELVGHIEDVIRKLEQQLRQKTVMSKVRGNGDLGKPGTPTS